MMHTFMKTAPTSARPRASHLPTKPPAKLFHEHDQGELAALMMRDAQGNLDKPKQYRRPASAPAPVNGGHRETVANRLRKVFEDVQSHPGTTTSEIANRTGLPKRRVAECVRSLLKRCVLREVKGAYPRQLADADSNYTPPPKKTQLTKSKRAILDYIKAHPGSTSTEIAEALGMKRKAVGAHILQIKDGWGLIRSTQKTHKSLFRHYAKKDKL